MSLNNALSQVLRPSIPANVLAACEAGDDVLVENLLYIALEVLPFLNVTLTTVEKDGTQYILRVPFCKDECSVSLQDMTQIHTYSPARVFDVAVSSQIGHGNGNNNGLALLIYVHDATCRATCTQYDIIRINKRKR